MLYKTDNITAGISSCAPSQRLERAKIFGTLHEMLSYIGRSQNQGQGIPYA
jgi:hypothetical protein